MEANHDAFANPKSLQPYIGAEIFKRILTKRDFYTLLKTFLHKIIHESTDAFEGMFGMRHALYFLKVLPTRPLNWNLCPETSHCIILFRNVSRQLTDLHEWLDGTESEPNPKSIRTENAEEAALFTAVPRRQHPFL